MSQLSHTCSPTATKADASQSAPQPLTAGELAPGQKTGPTLPGSQAGKPLDRLAANAPYPTRAHDARDVPGRRYMQTVCWCHRGAADTRTCGHVASERSGAGPSQMAVAEKFIASRPLWLRSKCSICSYQLNI